MVPSRVAAQLAGKPANAASSQITNKIQHPNIMKRTLTTSLTALSAALLLSFTLASCESPHHNSTGGWHNMGVGPKENHPMPDANMPGRR